MGVANIRDRPTGSDEAVYVRRAQLTFDVLLQGMWRVQMLCALRRGPVRLVQLGRLIPGVSKKVVARQRSGGQRTSVR
jgi:DNA-binding HxlR family transcriptional regulator